MKLICRFLFFLIYGLLSSLALFVTPSYSQSGAPVEKEGAPEYRGRPPANMPLPSPPKEVLRMFPAEIYQAYQTNELAAQKRFDGKIIQTTGNIHAISLDFTKRVVIRFEMMPYNYLNAELRKDQEAAAEKLARGYIITVRCETMRFILGSPYGSGCSIVPAEPTSRPANAPDSKPQQQAFKPSFDCGKATTNVEIMICRSQELSESDRVVAKLYLDAVAKTIDKQAQQSAQVKWRTGRRDKCQTVDCLVLAYGDRERELRAELGR